jgi:hypothetical protein
MAESRQEIVARALWEDGNNRIGMRAWETVKNAYMAEAGHAIAALTANGWSIVPTEDWQRAVLRAMEDEVDAGAGQQ